ncbi:hypothetical protein MBEHAL_0471 [Halarchaeum acidiphilum MH1-52-1]|uniref:Uncharacterized protein n=1 Tax=Halarchaeum acidiphilum MH1-52-1 TaxID=1261545 RepID=U2YDF6_9EURY|nr:hypothetical protein MBEHAL_0471 [Halarchaeum acidiphilum MH1-52-1]
MSSVLARKEATHGRGPGGELRADADPDADPAANRHAAGVGRVTRRGSRGA